MDIGDVYLVEIVPGDDIAGLLVALGRYCQRYKALFGWGGLNTSEAFET
jgi:hypothetical protein